MPTMYVCTGKACSSRYSEYIHKRLLADKERFDTDNLIAVETCGCRGNCDSGPTVLFDKELLTRSNPIKASEVFLKRLAAIKEKYSHSS